MLIKNPEKPHKRTLRERIYEEVVRLILAGELPSGGWVDEKRVIDGLRVSRTPFREAIGYLQRVGWSRSSLIAAITCAVFPAARPRISTNYSSGSNVSRSSWAVPQMSDRDIKGLENILMEADTALQRGDAKTFAMHDREFYENIAEQSGNSALIEALARVSLQIRLCAQSQT